MRTLVTILSLTVSTCIFAQKEKSFYLNWHDKGHDNITFQSSDLKYTEKGKFYYYLSNDRDNLYIDLRIFDKDVQRQVIKSGLTVWINTDGKKGKKTGLRYPARTGNQGKPDMQSIQNTPGGMEGRRMFSGGSGMQTLLAAGIELIGLADSDHSFISAAEMNTFRGSMKFDKEGNMWYELIFPLAKMPEASDKKKKNNGSIVLGLSYPGINPARMGGGPGRGMSEEGDGGMGGYGGGGMGRGMGGGMGGRGGGGGRSGGGRGGRPYGDTGEGMGTASVAPVIFWMKDVRFATEK